MAYFKLISVDICWLEEEIAKGTIFYRHYSFGRRPGWVPCGEFRGLSGNSYYCLPTREVLNMINKRKNVYWRN